MAFAPDDKETNSDASSRGRSEGGDRVKKQSNTEKIKSFFKQKVSKN